MRRDLHLEEKVDTIRAMSDYGMTREGIAQAFGVTPATITAWEKRARGDVAAHDENASKVQSRQRAERIAELTAQGRSASEIAAILNVTPRTVVRARTGSGTGRSQVGRPVLRELVAALRTQVDAGADASDILDALETFTDTLTVPQVNGPGQEAEPAVRAA